MLGLRSKKFSLLVFAALVVGAAALFGATRAHADSPSVVCNAANAGPTGVVTVTAAATSTSDLLQIIASSGSYQFILDGSGTCSLLPDDHASGYPSVVVNGTTLPTIFHQQGDPGLSFAGEAGVANTLDLSGLTNAASVSVISGTATWAANQTAFSGVTNFNGSPFGTTFIAGGTGGYTFTGIGAGAALNLSAAGSGISISAASGTVSGLTSGGNDNFSGVGTFDGSSSGGTTMVAGSSSLSFQGQSTGNVLDFSQVATSLAVPLCVNVSGTPVNTSCGMVSNNSAKAGLSTYTFSGVKSITSSADGFSTFLAGSTGGYTFAGGGSGNTLDLGAANSGVSVSVPAGTVSGLTTGGSDSFSGILTFVGPSVGHATFTAGSVDGQSFTSAGSSNTFVVGSGTATFTDAGVSNTLDFSPVVTSSGSPLKVNLSGGQVFSLADGQAGFSTPIYTFSGITTFKGASSGYTDFLGGSSLFNVQGQGSGNKLDFTDASGSFLSVNLSGGTVLGQATDTAQVGLVTDGVTGITNFVGLPSGNSMFRAPDTGGYTFTGNGPSSSNTLDLSAAGSGVTVSVPDGTVSGLSSGGDDSFSGIGTFQGSSAGGTTLIVGSSSLTFNGQGTGNALDFSQVATSFAAPLCVNVSGQPEVMGSCGTVGNNRAVAGLTTDSFDDVSSFIGSADGFTTFAAGSTGGYTFAGQAFGNTLDLSAVGPSATVAANSDTAGDPGTVTGLTGGSDSFSGIQQITGSPTIIPAQVTNVSSTTANGSYKTGDVIAVTVTFSEPVTVTGTPQLVLNSGGTASYSSGSGTSTLSFSYTVGAGQNANPLDEASTSALTLNGGTIHDGATNAANLTLPAPGALHSLGANKNIVIDTAAPTITNVSSTTANGSYKAGDGVAVTVTFSEPVNVTGTPLLALNSGGTASFASGSGTSTLTFNYTVGAGQNSADLDYTSTSALTLNGGTIDDAATNPANLTLPLPGATGSLGANKSIVIDTTPPTITIGTPPSNNPASPTVYTFGSVPNASYSCNDGSGSGVAAVDGCVGKVDNTTTVSSGSPLVGSVGSHTLKVTSTDNAGNTTSSIHYYTVQQAPTSILYTGDQSVTLPAAVRLSATLSSSTSACYVGQSVTFAITDSANSTTIKSGTTTSTGAVGPIADSLPEGVYTVEVSYAGTASCLASQDEATIVVGSAGSKATGGGWTTVNGVGRVNFAFVVDQVAGTGTGPANPAQYKGQYVLVKPNGWRVKGTFGNAVGGTYVVTSTRTGKSGSGTGTGSVYVWNPASATFVPATNGGNVSFSIGFADNGSAGKKQTTPDQFANHDNYDPAANGYNTTLNPFPNFTIQAIKGGNVTIS